MFKSMTGYGSAVIREEGMQISVEILSVNRKHLDINIILPRHLARFDPDIRKVIAASVFRGHLVVRISVIFEGASPLTVKPNIALAQELYKGWQEIATSLFLKEEFSLDLLENEPDLFAFEETPLMQRLQPILLRGVEEALKPFLDMRKKEGKALETDIKIKLGRLLNFVKEIEKNSMNSTEKYRQKLLTKMQEAFTTIDSSDERLLKEIALFSEKIDIAEEILRLHSHLDQFQKLLSEERETPGKTAEFLLQELQREVNTIGSKSSELTITKLVVEIKGDLERIREQMQNVE